MFDTMPLWFWLPAAIILIPLAFMAVTVKVSSAEEPPSETPLDALQSTGTYPKAGA